MNKISFAAVMALACAAPFAQASLAGTATKPTQGSAPAAMATKAAATTKSTAATKLTAAAKAAESAESALIEQFVTLQDKAISTFLGLGKTLRSVKDQKSADAAAPTVKQAGENLFNIISAVEALGEPSEAAQQAIMARVANEAEKTKIVEQVMVPLLTLMMQNPPCYGSTALNTELGSLLTNLQGAAGVEEEEGEEDAPIPLQEPDSDEMQP